jgi:hypothetical protein
LRWGRSVVGFEYVKAFQLLVQHCQRLELLGLLHLRLEPVLDFILLFFDEVLVVVVEMSVLVRIVMVAAVYSRTCSVAAVLPAISVHWISWAGVMTYHFLVTYWAHQPA